MSGLNVGDATIEADSEVVIDSQWADVEETPSEAVASTENADQMGLFG